MVPEFPTSIVSATGCISPPVPLTIHLLFSNFILAPSILIASIQDRVSAESKGLIIVLSPLAIAAINRARIVCDFEEGMVISPERVETGLIILVIFSFSDNLKNSLCSAVFYVKLYSGIKVQLLLIYIMIKSGIPLVSVIIPVYNRFEMAKEAVSSVIGQTYRNLEVIIVDDGSIDMTSTLAVYFGDDLRVKYLKIKHNGMPGFVRNKGVEISSGKYLAFLDSDDLWVDSKLEKQIGFMENNSTYKVVHTREAWVRNGKTISQSGFNHKRFGNIFSDALVKCILGPSTIMLEKDLYIKLGGFRDDLEIAEDYELWLRLTDSNNIGYIDEPLITKRAGHVGQLSEKYGQIEIFRIRGLQKLVEQNYFKNGNQQQAENELAKKCRIYAAGCKKRNKIEEAEIYESIAFRYGT